MEKKAPIDPQVTPPGPTQKRGDARTSPPNPEQLQDHLQTRLAGVVERQLTSRSQK